MVEISASEEKVISKIDEDWKEGMKKNKAYLDYLVTLMKNEKTSMVPRVVENESELCSCCEHGCSSSEPASISEIVAKSEEGNIIAPVELIEELNQRKIENEYFKNIEQAERKLNQVFALKSQWLKMYQNGEIIDRSFLRPIAHPNPWRADEPEIVDLELVENSKTAKNVSRCVIS
ncbi:unnamed protein product [Caenorhabditis bovis]|uniref:Uncharacterized protein n=1 Tax=Caenorhabditis bovis TaxID=2654633 RepID=A0A8S1FBZ0_9PELO|nr:unnamed protein product [Caenorhabditis bovis]